MSCRVLIFKIIMVVVFWRTIIIIAYKESTGAYNKVCSNFDNGEMKHFLF